MVKHADPDKVLVKMPSLRAVKSFVAAAKYLNFTRAAESLCVSQAAISRQIRELEAYLGVSLFKRVGRAVELTEAGTIFYDAAYLSFVNIAQAAERIQDVGSSKKVLTICCTPAFSSLWLTRRLPSFFADNPDIDINVVTTENFLQMEPGVYPDLFINKVADTREGYSSIALFYDLIYPVCTPNFLEKNPEVATLDGICHSALLNLSPYGRSQIAEHVDWGVWLSFFDKDVNDKSDSKPHIFNANDYNMLIQMVLNDQGVSLGWNHLVYPLIESGRLVKPVDETVELKEKLHYLSFLESKASNEAFIRFKEWILSVITLEKTSVV
ncbi:LysR family transcriptional regulator [Marinobacterium lutimaris]|uniref:Transcriptional regulator, LysR family n=1 Tax=Marinobacterium lutimaris TaxID=568106 RepID=A0A1H5VDV8_9GAMM|nr:LysR family transcriptional regulator [Marinobacterium lutimaris]SEF85433.1 transcriptional regulator, LysR family [Marinobacterium lutimaris]